MGRTLHYEVRSEKPIDWSNWREIRAVYALMNLRFTWTCEDLSIENVYPEEVEPRSSSAEPTEPPVRMRGLTKIGPDDWNAELICRFVAWLSRRLPDATVKLHDEGRYVLLGYLLLRAGRFEPDTAAIAEHSAYLETHGRGGGYLLGLYGGLTKAENGEFVASVSAGGYADRSEIKSLNIPKEDLATMTLHELSRRFAFPWDTEHLEKTAA